MIHILALAGLDYSGVREPDYDPDRIRQSTAVTDAIYKIGDAILSLWQQRAELQRKIREKGGHPVHRRNRQIYYDTDGIAEQQHETVQICDNCAGALKIDSSADNGAHILAITLPLNACSACRHVGSAWYESADPAEYDFVFLQDRPNDTFEKKSSR